jgi:hypothetical protein
MSYSIYYDRAFIRVNDKFVPMVNSGSNNCFECRGNRQIPEKDWGVLNWKRYGRVLFTADEIREIAQEYDWYNQESGMLFKSRNRLFEPGEFERWVVNGMKRAYTVEEYRKFGNELYVLDYSSSEYLHWPHHPFSTTEELLTILDKLNSVKELGIKMANNRDVYRPVNHRPRGHGLSANDLTEYYVLGGEGIYGNLKGMTVYLVKMKPHGISYLTYETSPHLKVFRSERDAEKYIQKYSLRLKVFADFKPVQVSKVS